MSKRLTIFYFLLLTGFFKLHAQHDAPCPPGAPSNPTCAFACISCQMDGLEDKNQFPSFGGQDITSCGTGAPFNLENPRWYSFIASSTVLSLEITLLNCSTADGLEIALVEDCKSDMGMIDALACASGGNPMVFTTDGLKPGNLYYLVIDGVNGNVCEYKISDPFGTTVAPELGPIGTITGPLEVCPNAVVTYTIPTIQNALSYTWSAPPGSKINGGTNVYTISALDGDGTSVEIQFGTQGGNICVTAANVCDTPLLSCIQVTNLPIPVTVLPDMELCYEELPFFWEEQPNFLIAAPGTYTFTSTPYASYLGCDSLVRQKIVAKQRKFKNLPPTWLCNDDCMMVGDFTFCDAGSYSETLTAADGCDSLVNFTIVKLFARAGIQKPDTLTCRDPQTVLLADSTTTTGSLVRYAWVNAQGDTLSTSTSATVSGAGPYFFIVNNYGGGLVCSDTAMVTVPVDQVAPMANAGPNRILTCDEPVLQLQGSGSSGPQYTYLWLAFNGGNIVSGASTLTPTINAIGTYRLRVTNEHNGCTQTDNMLVTADQVPPTLSAMGGTYNCIQTAVTLQATTGAAGPTYAWTGPNNFTSSEPSPMVGVAGEYTIVVTDSITGCTNSAIAIVTADVNPPGATAIGGALTCVEDTVVLSGSSPANNPAFAWAGPNGFSSSLANPVVSLPGSYVLTVTGTNSCTSVATATVVLDTMPPGATLAVSANLNCNNATVNLTASSTAPAGQLNHLWTRPDNSTTSTGTNPVLSAAIAGQYSVLITNTTNGCVSSANANVVQSPAVTASVNNVTNVACFGQQNGSATAAGGGGNGTFSYAWNTGDNTATVSGLSVGTYTVVVTDGEQCTATATVSITQPPVLAANTSAMPQMANGAADGSASANPSGGTPGYTYLWSTNETTASITGLLPGSYTVTVTDANGCTAVAIASVNAYDCTIDADVDATDATCFEANDGMATVVTTSGQAPFTYAWSTGETTETVTGLQPGIYTVIVTDAANCPEAIAFSISEPSILRANATAVNMSGPATNDGMASSNPTGGTSPYTILWSTGESTETISNLSAGTYTITVTDANGCEVIRMVEVLPGNCGIVVNFITAPAQCNGQANGSATAILNGGTGPFTYAWSSGGNAETESNLTAGTYTLSITDANNCDLTEEVTIMEPPLLTVELDSTTSTSCPNLPEGTAVVVGGGGVNPLTYQWSNGQTGANASDLIAGTYTVTVVDGNNCTATLQVVVTAVDIEPPVIASDSATAPLGMAGNITLSVQSLNLDVSDNCSISEVTFVPASYNCSQLGPHDVVVRAMDGAGNITVDTIVVTVVDNLPPSLVCPASVVRCFGDNVVQYTAPVATDNCLGNGGMFALVTGLPSGAAFPVGTTTNTYTYTDADGNVGSCTFEVTVLTQLQLTLDTILPDKGGLELGGVYISVNGSLSPYTFEWFRNGVPFPLTTEDLDSVGSGSYTVRVIDEIGCTIEGGPYLIDSLVNTKTPDWASGLLIFPNPTTGLLYVISPEQLNEEVQLTVFDMTGRLIQQQTATGPLQVDFDLSRVPQGMYTVLIRIDQQVLAKKIIISR
ncbi:MAG: T9SS type A sorting domain-containing protein [Lewinellaceae bacterium]|nr:T9SS type A sorting domain-containing protein [Saprospiraceae bacterium]MCB9331629.1 T9SS type A sorting domain-containing protein [Lewinellaceae bacterium]